MQQAGCKIIKNHHYLSKSGRKYIKYTIVVSYTKNIKIKLKILNQAKQFNPQSTNMRSYLLLIFPWGKCSTL